MVLHRHVKDELRLRVVLELLDHAVVGGRVARRVVVLLGALEIVDVQEGVEAHLLVHAVAVPVGGEVGVDGTRLVAELREAAGQSLDLGEVVERVGVFAVADKGHRGARQELELGVAGAAAVD